MSSFDWDLALAISLSLQTQQPQAPNSRDNPIVVVDSDDEEDSVSSSALKTSAIEAAASLNSPTRLLEKHGFSSTKYAITRFTPQASSPTKPLAENGATTSSKSVIEQSMSPIIDNLEAFRTERAKMEQERIARLKRKRPDLVETDDASDLDQPLRKSLRDLLYPPSNQSKGKSKETSPYSGSFGIPDENGRFWYGVIRQTTNDHATQWPNTNPVFGLTDILPPTTSSHPDQTLSLAIIASCAVDLMWLRGYFSQDVPVIFIGPPDTDGKAAVKCDLLSGWVQTSPELARGHGYMHVKLMMLFYKSGRLRVVITSANFNPDNWTKVENSVWLQDVPLCASPTPVPFREASPIPVEDEDNFLYSIPPPPRSPACTFNRENFAKRLEYVLESLNVKPALEVHLSVQQKSQYISLPLRNIDELHTRWDWSRVTARLITSVAGRHVGWSKVIGLGHVALMNAVRDMGAASESTKIECQGSAIGDYSADWTNEFMSSARGISPDTWLDIPKSRRAKAPHPDGLRIVFPSLATVNESASGKIGGDQIFCRRTQWELSRFPKELFVDSISKRGNLLMHSKMILGTLSEEGKIPGWFYIGSHNFTASAWGKLSITRHTPIISIANYELGVVIPLENAAQGDNLACWKRPARPYVMGKDLPWMQDDDSSISDVIVPLNSDPLDIDQLLYGYLD